MVASRTYFFKLLILFRKGVRKTVDLLWKFQNNKPRTPKLFVRTHLDHGDITYDQIFNFTFHQKLA